MHETEYINIIFETIIYQLIFLHGLFQIKVFKNLEKQSFVKKTIKNMLNKETNKKTITCFFKLMQN